MLAALGRFCYRHHRWIAATWLALVLVGFGLGSQVFDRLAETEYAAPGSDSVQGSDLLADVADVGEQVVVLVDDHEVDDPQLRAAVQDATADVRDQPHVLSAVSWYDAPNPTMRAEDGRASLVVVEVDDDLAADEEDTAHRDLDRRMRAIHDDVPGAEIRIGGQNAVFDDLSAQVERDIRRGELIALPITFVLLVVIFTGLVAALLPLAGAIAAIAGSLLALLGFSYVVGIDSNAVSITTIMGLGLSIDYALLVVSRYREERGNGLPGEVAASRTVAAAGRTVCFSALTVAAAMSGLLAFKTEMFHAFAIAGISVIVVAAAAALTLVPAPLGLAGRWVRVPTKPLPDDGFFARVARGTQRVAPLVAVGVAALLLLAGAPFLGVKFGGVDASALPKGTESRQVAEVQEDRFPGGDADPVQVVAEVSRSAMAEYGRDVVADLPDVERVEAHAAGNGVAVLDVHPEAAGGGETDEQVGERVVRDIRAHPAEFSSHVTGSAALLVDTKKEIADRLPVGLAVIALTTFVLLFLMTGSLFIPLKAIVMDVLSLGATFGMLVLVFQEGHLSGLLNFDPPGSLDLFVPILVFAFAFGLSMDYEVFLLSRIKEAYDATGDNRRAVQLGLQRSGRIITSAALLIIVVCAGFVSADLVMIKQMGLAMCVAVAVDATLVRCLLVPATMSLLGQANWWAPRWLFRVHQRFGLHEHPAAPARGDDDAPVAVGVTRQLVPTAAGHDVPLQVIAGAADGPVLLFWPALGVPAGYYARFGEALARHGVTVALADLPGQGDSAVDSRTADFGYGDVVDTDLAAAVAAMRARFPGRRLLVGGNSIGGQLAVLYAAKHPSEVDGVVLVAAGTVYFAGFTAVQRRVAVLGYSQFVAAVSAVAGHWPGDRLNFGGRQPARLMRDWARNARTGRYRLGGVDYDPLLARLQVPALGVSVAGDHLAPAASMDHLCGKLRSARVDRWHYAPDGVAPGHLKWARCPDAVAGHIAGWLTAVGLAEPVAVTGAGSGSPYPSS